MTYVFFTKANLSNSIEFCYINLFKLYEIDSTLDLEAKCLKVNSTSLKHPSVGTIFPSFALDLLCLQQATFTGVSWGDRAQSPPTEQVWLPASQQVNHGLERWGQDPLPRPTLLGEGLFIRPKVQNVSRRGHQPTKDGKVPAQKGIWRCWKSVSAQVSNKTQTKL